jgi:flagellar L-ring protein precursor FlgH
MIAAICAMFGAPVFAQTTSIAEQHAAVESGSPTRDHLVPTGNPVLEETSLIAIKEAVPKQFKPHDLVTIVVNERTKYEADGSTNNKRQSDFTSELDAFIKLTGDGVGSALFRRGKPNINYKSSVNQKNDAESEREDKLATRITGEIIDVKPNGNLVIEARGETIHDDEIHVLTFTGVCRSVDVTPDNTVLSTQVADRRIHISTKGNIRNATRSGWMAPIYDRVRPL